MNNSTPLVWASCALTHVGHVRTVNEDAFLDRSDIQLWVVADGMGGHHAGDVASQCIVDSLNELATAPPRLSAYVGDVEDSLMNVNKQLRQLAAEHQDQRTIGSTVMALVAKEDYCAYLWAGDSRIYRARNGTFTRMTRDHSQIEEMIDRGILSREDAEAHPAANVITRAVGASDDLFVDIDMGNVQSGDTFVLCSDGLYKHVTEEEMAEESQGENVDDICQKLIDLTLARGAMDNVTVVVVRAT